MQHQAFSKQMEIRCLTDVNQWKLIFKQTYLIVSELAQELLQSSHRNHQSNETSTDIKDSQSVDHLHFD